VDPKVIAVGAALIENDTPGQASRTFRAEQIVPDETQRLDLGVIAEPCQQIGDALLGRRVDRRIASQIEPIEGVEVRKMQHRYELRPQSVRRLVADKGHRSRGWRLGLEA
jgi:hypothetical protein